METLYESTPYLKEFDAVVTGVVERGDGHFLVTLDRTAFYPEGG